MTEETATLLAIVQEGTVPVGYTKMWHLMPEDWNDVPLSYIFKKKSQKNKGNNVKTVFTNSAVNGIIPQSEYFEKNIANSENTEGYFVVDPLDYVYNPRISENAPYGPFKRNDTGLTGIVSPLYTVLTPRKGFAKSEFLHYYLESAQWHKYAYSIANYGARFDRMNITDDELMRLPIAWPSLTEQVRIAEILMQCDKVIELKQKRIEEEKKKKKFLMQTLLNPTSGFRLPGFSRIWKESKIGDIAKMFSGGTPTSSNQSYYATSGIPFIRSGEISSSRTALFLSEAGFNSSAAKMVCKGDLLYALYGANSGECFISKIDGAINQAILCIRSEVVDIRYLYYVLANRKDWIVATYLQGGQGNLSGEIIKKLSIFYPQREEQAAIYTVLNAQDSVIEKLEEELSLYQERKIALAQLLLTGIVRTTA